MSRKSYLANRIDHKSRSCTNKRIYNDALTAIKACLSIQHREPHSYVRVYMCFYGNHLHITSGGYLSEINGLRKVLKKTMKLMSNADWWIRCSEEIREQIIDQELFAIKRLLKLRGDHEATFPGRNH